MRLSARLFAPLLAAVAFAVPATVPAAHAAQVPSAAFIDTGVPVTAVPTVVMKAGTQLQIVNATTIEHVYHLNGYNSPTIPSLGTEAIEVGTNPVSLNPSAALPGGWAALTKDSSPTAIAYVIVL